jgi:hypothetical protein
MNATGNGTDQGILALGDYDDMYVEFFGRANIGAESITAMRTD